MSDTDRVVYKYPLDLNRETTVHLVAPAKVVHFGKQGSLYCVWVEHPISGRPDTTITFYVVGTGHPIPEGYEHVQSIFDGPFVWHLYRSPW